MLEELLKVKREQFSNSLAKIREFICSIPNKSSGSEAPRLAILSSRQNIYMSTVQLISEAREEVLVFKTAKSVIRSYSANVNEVLLQAMRLHVACRIICDINHRNMRLMSDVAKYVPLRHIERQRVCFIIVDRKCMIGFLVLDEKSKVERRRLQYL